MNIFDITVVVFHFLVLVVIIIKAKSSSSADLPFVIFIVMLECCDFSSR